ncbi:large head outer capsid protein [Enterobacteria phage RB5]|uniref:Highly immunogenic outer capsid protein n=6 Tax=Tequatrovirus RB3 TaxID=1914203 RepID=A0A097J193_BPR03|nr:Hoc-like head decoration [Escherichia phage RB3]AIT73184.1 large head outer capsid protein [Enterobacteria phage RB5]AIT73455.1 large head outer capsid protein [Enterobacteria phage RB6]AIT73726.1 large head outer capsid protein [Enterobacteria phage RB7]AIT73998.1 large head outer capsid protein [Enterobacteria phage RB9]AIT74271.1 large head outer capsid protein [Enterobacteria phage RB10]
MAFTVDITPKTPTGVIDETKQFTATPSGETGGGTITYAWSVDNAPQEGSAATFDYVLKGPAGQKTIKVVATNTIPDSEAETAEISTTITVQNKTQTTTLAVTPDSPSAGVIGTPVQFTAALASQPVGASATYQWYVDDSQVGGETNSTFSYTPTTSGVKRIKCVAQVTAENYNEKEVTSNEVSLTVNKKTMNPQVTLTPPSINVQQDASATFTANVTNAPEEAQIAYSWKKDSSPVEGSTNVYTVDTSSIGSQTIEVTATVTAADYDSKTITAEGQVQVTDKVAPEPEGELPYVHPLPHRTSAYIWCGWWVMDEIQKMTEEGKDWKTEDPDSKYYLHRYTLQKMMKDYPEVDVQESRNGYIIHKTALETGIIYTYP